MNDNIIHFAIVKILLSLDALDQTKGHCVYTVHTGVFFIDVCNDGLPQTLIKEHCTYRYALFCITMIIPQKSETNHTNHGQSILMELLS